MLRLDFNLVLEMINLVVLFLILRKFLFRPVMNIMEKRKAMIAEGLKNADEQQEAARELKKQYEDALSGAKDESLRMIERGEISDARTEYDRILKARQMRRRGNGCL
ncbi:MAG: ATP synthase F0 subunit B [[Clostridium] scindens]